MMNGMLAQAWVEIRVDDNQVDPQLDEVKGSLDGFVTDAIATLASLKTAFAGFRLLGWASEVAADAEQISIAMNTIIKDTRKTEKLLQDLREFSDVTPFTPEQVNKSAKMLIAFGTELKDINTDLKMVGDLAAGSGSVFDEVALVFSQIRGEGRLLTQDYRQLAMRGINLREQLVKDLKISESEFMKFMSDGKISFEAVRQAMLNLTSDGGMFADAMQKQSESMNGRLSTLEGKWTAVAKAIGEKVNPVKKVLVELLIKLGEAYSYIEAQTGGLLSILVASGIAVTSLGLAYIFTSAAIAKFNIIQKIAALVTQYSTVALKAAKFAAMGLAIYIGTRLVTALLGADSAMKQLSKSAEQMQKMTDKLVEGKAQKLKEIFDDADAIKDKEQKLKLLNEELARYKMELRGSESQLNKDKKALSDADTAYNSFSSLFGIDNKKDEEIALDASQALYDANKEAVDKLQYAIDELGEATEDNVAATKKAAKEEADRKKAIEETIEALEAEAVKSSMTSEEHEIYKLKQLGATEADLERAKAAQAATAASEAAADAEAARIEEEERLAQVAQSNADAIQSINDNLLQQVATFGGGALAADLYRAKLAGATDEQLKFIEEQHKMLNDLQVAEDMKNAAEQIIEANKGPAEKYAEKLEEINNLVKGGFLEKGDGLKAVAKAKDAFLKSLKDGNKVAATIGLKPEFIGLAEFNDRIQSMVGGTDEQVELTKAQLEEMAKQALSSANIEENTRKTAQALNKIGTT